VVPVILVTSLGIGASVAVVFVVNTPLLTSYSTPDERTALLGLNGALNLLAGILGSLLGGFLPEFFARRSVANSAQLHALRPLLVAPPSARALELAMLAGGALALPSIIPILMMREERPPAGAVHDDHGDPHDSPRAADWGRAEPMPLRARLARAASVGREIAHGTIGRFTLTQALLGFGAGLFIPFIGNYFVEHLHRTYGFIGVLNAVTAAVLATASLLSAWLAARFGKVRGAVTAQAVSVIFLLALGAFPLVALATGAFLTRSFLMGLTGPPLQAYYMEAVPERSRVLASSIYNVAYQVVWAVGAAIGGILIGVAGYGVTFYLAAPFYAASALLIARWFGAGRASAAATPVPTPTPTHAEMR
jgi:MFS family permease